MIFFFILSILFLSVSLFLPIQFKISALALTFISLFLFLRRIFSSLKYISELVSRISSGEVMITIDRKKYPEISDIIRKLEKISDIVKESEISKIERERLMKEMKFIKEKEEKIREILSDYEVRKRKFEIASKYLGLIYEVSSFVASSSNLQELFSKIGEVMKKVGFPRFAILLKSDDGEYVDVKWSYGFEKSLQGIRFRIGEGISGIVSETGQEIYIPDIKSDKRYLFWKGEYLEDGSFLSVPIKYKDEVFGVMNFNSPKIGAFSDEDRGFIKFVAAEAAVAIKNMKLINEVKELYGKDYLTKFYTRHYMYEKIQEFISSSIPFGMIMIDIDNFKKINLEYGYIAGDEFLSKIAKMILSNIRKTDIPIRYGGDEFIIIFKETIGDDLIKASDKIRSIVWEKSEPKVTVSIGVVEYPKHGENLQKILEKLTTFTQIAKNDGGNKIFTE